MSHYTTQVRWIVENYTTDMEGQPITARVTAALPKIFNFSFPMWTEQYRATLEKKIIMHYFNKEIGFETLGLWKFYLEERLNLIMPYYNKLYETVAKDFDYMTDVDLTETHQETKTGKEDTKYSATDTTKSDLTGKDMDNGSQNTNRTTGDTTNTLESDMPQANYANEDYATRLVEVKTNGTDNADTTTQNTRNTTQNVNSNTTQSSTNGVTKNDTENYTHTRTGVTGRLSFTELMIQYRDSLINIDNMVIKELHDLFMLIY
mgnify:FL=1